MNISLSPKANYKTQSAAYDKLLVGKPLSSRQIVKYARNGHYGPELQKRFAPKQRSVRVFKPAKPSIDSILATL